MGERMVIDYEASEKGQQRRKSEAGRLLHCCCICGALDVWTDGKWTTYCSVKDMDDGAPIPKFCSDNCRKQGGARASNVTEAMKEAARDAQWRAPKIVYRKATSIENYRSALDAQRQRANPKSP